ncbi:hypothetical protein FLX27_30765 [Agrobacterium tumefaciens]|nr:hypothetical protein FLX27_30765 [Agrobacterium tumefaciens]
MRRETLSQTWRSSEGGARACRIRPDVVENLALCRHGAPLGYILHPRRRGFCPICLEEDRGTGHDQYLRRSWSRAQAVACPIHRVRLRYFCSTCFMRSDFRFEYQDGRAELICPDCLAAVSRAPPEHSEVRNIDLLIATMDAIDDAEKGRGELKLTDVRKATRFLWHISPDSENPNITLFGVERPFGRAPTPVNREAPMAELSLTWRSTTLLTIAQMLDVGGARLSFGAPDGWLTLSFQRFESSLSSCRPANPTPTRQMLMKFPQRSDSDYVRLAAATMKDPRLQRISELKGRSRSKAISRLARQVLDSIPNGPR